MKQFIARNPDVAILSAIIILALTAFSIFGLPGLIQSNQEAEKSHSVEQTVKLPTFRYEHLDRALVDEKVDNFHKDGVFNGTEWNTFRNLNGKSAESDARANIKNAYDQLDTMKTGTSSYASAERNIGFYRAYLDSGVFTSNASDSNFLVAVNTIKDSCSAPDPAAEVAKWDMDSAKSKPVLGTNFEMNAQNKAVVNKAFQKVMAVGVAQLCK